MADRCAALDWDKKHKDYVECDDSAPKLTRLTGIITVQLLLCDAHRRVFEEECARFGGKFDEVRRVEIVKG